MTVDTVATKSQRNQNLEGILPVLPESTVGEIQGHAAALILDGPEAGQGQGQNTEVGLAVDHVASTDQGVHQNPNDIVAAPEVAQRHAGEVGQEVVLGREGQVGQDHGQEVVAHQGVQLGNGERGHAAALTASEECKEFVTFMQNKQWSLNVFHF